MSSGRRPNGTGSPSAWRSISASKKTAPTSVSLVFAEPEPGAPLQSAAAKLPPVAYTNDHMLRKRDRFNSTSTLRDDQKDTISISEGSLKRPRTESGASQATASADTVQSCQVSSEQSIAQSASDTHQTSQSNGLAETSHQALMPPNTTPDFTLKVPTETLNVPFPSRESIKSSTTPKTSPTGRSWFGSLSRSKGKDKAVILSDEPANYFATSDIQASPADATSSQASSHNVLCATAVQPELLVTDPLKHPSQQMPQRQTTFGWFAGSPTRSTSITRPPLSPTSPHSHSRADSKSSIPSSVDEEVPKLTVITPLNTSHPISVMQNGVGSNFNLSSLNPSSSRFTLSIPLLGRAKMPLDKAAAVPVPVAGDDRAGDKNGTDSIMRTLEFEQESTRTEQVSPTTMMTSDTPTITTARIEASSPEEQDTNAVDSQTREISSASWWGYVGWGPGNKNVPTAEVQPKALMPSPPSVSESSTVKPDSHLAVSIDVVEPPADAQRSTGTGNELESKGILSLQPDKPRKLTQKGKAPSVFSAGTTQSLGSTTWYVPWIWYPNTPTDVVSGSEGQDNDAKTTMTQSEIVKEEALARDREPHATVPTIEVTSPSPVASQAQKQINPIESTIFSNTSGWASFFSTTSLVVKRITDGDKDKDGSGMEVMDIDEEAGKPHSKATSASISTAVVADDGRGKDQGRPGVDGSSCQKPKLPGLKPDSEVDKSKADRVKSSAIPLTNSDSVKREAAKATKRTASPAPSAKSGSKSPGSPRNPNLVLPTWTDTFYTAPRSLVSPQPSSALLKTLSFVSGVLFQREKDERRKDKGKVNDKDFDHFGQGLPRAFDVIRKPPEPNVLRGCNKAVIIGVHGWFPGAVMRTVLGDPTGTSGKFVDMMLQALDEFQEKHNVKITKITKIPLEGEGTISKRVDKLYKNLQANKEWMNDLHAADVIFIATHSQGSIVSTHLLDRLIRDGHIRTIQSIGTGGSTQLLASGSTSIIPNLQPQRICCLALCGIHLGPLRYLSTSSLLQPYFQYFESAAARELFEFQDTESEVSKQYVAALANIMHHGTKMVYVASLNDQVVPMYSGLFTTASHPLILRALYIDGDAYQSSDFLSNLLVLLLRVMNSGISDSGLLAHLSEATAGSLNGIGHSTAYEELATYSLAVDYCFLANDGLEAHPDLIVDSFNAKSEQNDYEIPWALRDVIADDQVAHFFANEIIELRDAFRDWHPKTAILRDIKKKLQPIQRLPSSIVRSSSRSISKL